MTPSVWPSILAFLAVIALIPLSLAVLKRVQSLRPHRQGMLNLVGGLSVGPREKVAIVEAGGKWLVLGITAQSINLLTTLDESPELANTRSSTDAASASEVSTTASSANATPAEPGKPFKNAAPSAFSSLFAMMKKNAQADR